MIQPYPPAPIIKQAFRIEVEHFPGNPLFDTDRVIRLIRLHNAPLMSLVVHDLTPTPLAPGDTVVHTAQPGVEYTLLAVDGDSAWLHRPASGDHITVTLANLRRPV